MMNAKGIQAAGTQLGIFKWRSEENKLVVWLLTIGRGQLTTIYYLPGNRGRLHIGLGEELLRRGYSIAGRDNLGEFSKLAFAEKIECIADDLRNRYWHNKSIVIANSFGAYLFLHAQTLLPPFIGRVLLLSPVVGEAVDVEHMRFYVVSRSGKLHKLSESGDFPTPLQCEIHVGENDWQSNPEKVLAFAAPLGIRVNVIANGEHMLDRNYVRSVLIRWLPPSED
jgi:hypothetical protein